MTWRTERIAELRKELQQLEREEAEFILQQSDGSLRERCITLVEAGDKIAAIKHYREISGHYLTEARDAVREMVRDRTKP